MTTFTASEVRREAQVWTGPVRRMLHAYADRLEADEKAMPVAITCDGYDGNRTGCIKSDKPLPMGTNLYTHPAPPDAEKLAETLRECLADYSHPAFTDRHGMADRIRKALAAHSAQAQPLAASVTDAMVERAQDCLHDKGKDIGYYHMRAALEAALAAQENPNG